MGIINIATNEVERIKNEIHQRRIPSRNGGGQTVMDAGYNPLSMMEDYFFATTADGRGSKVETLPGGENLGQIDDIIYFQKKVYRSLNVPSGRLEQENTFSLGRATEITRDEVKFQKFIDRLRKKFSNLFLGILKKQLLLKSIITEQDWEKWKNDINVDFIRDNHFTELKESEILRERLQTMDQVSQYVGEYFSREWVLKNIMRFGDDDIEEMKKQVEAENAAGGDSNEEDDI